jgi:hypothetical protein
MGCDDGEREMAPEAGAAGSTLGLPVQEQARERSAKTMQGYCVKERMMRDIKDPKEVVLKNGRPAIQGPCAVCGTKITRFIKKSS